MIPLVYDPNYDISQYHVPQKPPLFAFLLANCRHNTRDLSSFLPMLFFPPFVWGL